MKTLLLIHASIYGEDAQSSKLARHFAEKWRRSNSGARIVTRNLTPDAMPHLTAARYQAFNTPADQRTAEQKADVAFSDRLVAELEAANVIVIAAPMYNFSVPSTLRDYFDHVARAGLTFRYTADGPHGLVTGRKAYVFITRGGSYSGDTDTQVPYLKQFLGFIGLTDIEFVLAEGMAMGDDVREQSLLRARGAIARLAPVGAAALQELSAA